MKTDFRTWDRSTLEQFAREARDKLVAMAQVEPVGVAGAMPGTFGFTMASFLASEVPIGTKLYTSAPSIPEGWQLVPVDPTASMCDAFHSAVKIHLEYGEDVYVENEDLAYKAMLSAAPKHQQPPSEQLTTKE